MPIVASDIKLMLSGGAANSNPNAALGGEISETEIVDATLHNLFDVVSGSESAAGDTEYRCFYVLNDHATLALQNARIYINTNTPSPDTAAAIGLGTAAIGDDEQTVANESTAPSGVTFSAAAGVGAALTIGDLEPGESKAVWVRRTIDPNASAYNNDNVEIAIVGDTAA